MPERKKSSAILNCKCPRCRQGNLFVNPWYKLNKFDAMHQHCPNCGLRYQVEPGFFFGAMYISYAFAIAILVTIAVTVNFFWPDAPTYVFIAAAVSFVLLTWPFSYRYSRTLYLYLFGGIQYEPKQ